MQLNITLSCISSILLALITLWLIFSLSCRCSSSGIEIQLPTRARWPSNTCHLDSKVVELIENSVATSPVRTLHLGITTYHQFCSRYGIPLLSPTLQHIGAFVAALMGSRSLSTIRVYLSAIHYFLLCSRASVSCLRSERLTAMLRGVERMSGGRTSTRTESADLDTTLHNYTVTSKFSAVDRAMPWVAVLVGFHGLHRSSEFLAPSSSTTEDGQTLATTVTIQLKRTKTTQNGYGGLVELRQTDNEQCFVSAIKRFCQLCQAEDSIPSSPVFKYTSGKFMYWSDLAGLLRSSLGNQAVISHSLRIGGASLLASRGANDCKIKRAGRWTSNAYGQVMLTNSMYANAVECKDVLADTRWSLAWLIMIVSRLSQPAVLLDVRLP